MSARNSGSISQRQFRSAWIIANPTAGGVGGQRKLEQAIEELRRSIPIDAFRWTRRRGDAEEWARDAPAQGVDLVIASGGDGTLNEVINGLVGTDVVLGILPSGTANVVAGELRIPRNPIQAVPLLLGGKIERLHLGLAQYTPLPGGARANGDRISRYFFFGAGLGFDAYVCHHLNLELKHFTRKGSYILSGLSEFLRYQTPRLHVSLDGKPPEVCSTVIFSNARSYAGDYVLAPEASLQSPELDACLFLGLERVDLIRYAWGVYWGNHTTFPDVKCVKMQTAEVRAEERAYIHLDGDTLGTSPASVSIVLDALSVITPHDWPAPAPKRP